MRHSVELLAGGIVAIVALFALFVLLFRVFLGIVVWCFVMMFVLAA